MKLEKIVETISFFVKVKFSKRIESNKNILIYGISRGGSTMLAEALVKSLNARLVWEPLFPYRKVFLERINPYSTHRYNKLRMDWNPHVSSHDYKEVNNYFDDLFTLKERNIRFYRFSDHKKFSSQKTTVFKFCFANFMFPYFTERYGFKSIILLRHPFAIAASSLAFGDNYKWHKDNYSQWKYRSNKWSKDFGEQFNNKLYLITSAFTLLVFQTVIQFKYILDSKDKGNTTVIYYEDLVLNPEILFDDLKLLLGKDFNLQEFINSLGKQSFSSKKGHMENDPTVQLSKWKRICTKEDINGGLEIFKAFNFDIYSSEITPNYKSL